MGLTLLQQVEGKKALLVFSDGEEIHSCLDGEAVLWAAKNSPALIYFVGLRGPGEEQRSYSSSWRDASLNQKQERALMESVEVSGGRSFRLRDIADLEQAFGEIAEELRSQYYLGYYPSGLKSTGEFREIQVKVGGHYKVRTRRGYYDSASWLGRGRTP
jgi:Ca-activated chloride channel family protein